MLALQPGPRGICEQRPSKSSIQVITVSHQQLIVLKAFDQLRKKAILRTTDNRAHR